MKKANLEIVKYSPEYAFDMRKICIETAENAQSESRQKELTAIYCDYYIEHERDNVFILIDKNVNRAVGYILCAPNYKRYRKIFFKEYIPKIKKLSISAFFEALGTSLSILPFCKKYPAHLHIDILPPYQRMGMGKSLIEKLENHLRENAVKGVLLGVGYNNKGARSFYKSCGFKELVSLKVCVIMAKNLQEV